MAKILWVAPHRDEWWVTREGLSGAEAMFDSREVALDWACRAARLRSPCVVRVQNFGGGIAAEFTFEESAATAA